MQASVDRVAALVVRAAVLLERRSPTDVERWFLVAVHQLEADALMLARGLSGRDPRGDRPRVREFISPQACLRAAYVEVAPWDVGATAFPSIASRLVIDLADLVHGDRAELRARWRRSDIDVAWARRVGE
ncbi:hypothetical protein GCM10028815_27890 [Mariniluteicoccus flavus]